MSFWAPFFTNQSMLSAILICSFFQGVCEGFQRFCPDFTAFLPNQNFWGCACTPCMPASYASDLVACNLRLEKPTWCLVSPGFINLFKPRTKFHLVFV